MRKRLLATLLALGSLAMPAAASAEDQEDAEPGWTAPRTEWGDPDLRGKWPIDIVGQTPRERPKHFGTRAELTDEEYEAAFTEAQRQLDRYQEEDKANLMGMGHWAERGYPLRQTSLIMEPADGRYPPMTEEGARLAAQQKSSWTETVFDWVDDLSVWDRCITRGMPGSMLPGAYNGGIEIFQAPGILAISLEMIHDTRVVYLDGRPAPPPGVTSWLGFSRGRWEGETLVIETTNISPGGHIGNVGNSPRPVPNSAAMKITERLTPTGPDNIRYEAWIEDPVVLTAPFKLDFPWTRNEDYGMFEYACHEGNISVRDYILATGTQFAEARAKRARELAEAE